MTRYLTPADYGILALFQAYIGFATPFIGMNLQNPISQSFFGDSKEKFKRTVFHGICIVTGASFLISGLLTIVLFFRPALTGIPIGWCYLIPWVAAFTMFLAIYLVVLRNQKKVFRYAIIENSNTLMNLTLSLIMVVWAGGGWQGRAVAFSVAPILFGFIAIVLMLRSQMMSWDFDFTEFKELLRVSTPLIFYSLGGIIIFMSDRIFIDRIAGKEALGIYAAAYSFGMIMQFVKDAMMKVANPETYELLNGDNPDRHEKIVKRIAFYSLLLLASGVLITLISIPAAQLMLNHRFYGAIPIIGWIVFGNALNGIYGLFFPIAMFRKRTHILTQIMVLAAIVSLVGNYFFISANGPVGAAQAMLLAFSLSSASALFYCSRIYELPWRIIFGLRPRNSASDR